MFKDIDFEGFEEFKDLYSINEYGNVYSKRTGKILKPDYNNAGYPYVVLYNKCKGKHLQLHRGVALAFIPNPDNHPIVMHLDNDPSNPYYKNLQWGDQKDNMEYCSKCNRCKIPDSRKYYEITNGANSVFFRGAEEAADIIGCKISTVWAAITNKSVYRYGPYKGYYTISHDTIKPFTINN